MASRKKTETPKLKKKGGIETEQEELQNLKIKEKKG